MEFSYLSGRDQKMDLDARIEELKIQHHALESALEEAGQRQPDDIEVHNLKKRKLQIKDEIARLT